MTANYACIDGRVKVVLYDERDGSPSHGQTMEFRSRPEEYSLGSSSLQASGTASRVSPTLYLSSRTAPPSQATRMSSTRSIPASARSPTSGSSRERRSWSQVPAGLSARRSCAGSWPLPPGAALGRQAGRRVVALLRPVASTERLAELGTGELVGRPRGPRRSRATGLRSRGRAPSNRPRSADADVYAGDPATPRSVALRRTRGVSAARLVHTGSAWVLPPGTRLDEDAHRSTPVRRMRDARRVRTSCCRFGAAADVELARSASFQRLRPVRAAHASRAVPGRATCREASRRRCRTVRRRDFNDVDAAAGAFVVALLLRRKRAAASTTSAPAARRRSATAPERSRTLVGVHLIRFGAGTTQTRSRLASSPIQPKCVRLGWSGPRDRLDERLEVGGWWLATSAAACRRSGRQRRTSDSMTTCRTCKSRASLPLPRARRPPARERFLPPGPAQRAGATVPARRSRLPRLRIDPDPRPGPARLLPALRLHPVGLTSHARSLRGLAQTLGSGSSPRATVSRSTSAATTASSSALSERAGARTLGIDPATNIVELAREKGVDVVNEYFTPQLARDVATSTDRRRSSSRRTRFITSGISTRSRRA